MQGDKKIIVLGAGASIGSKRYPIRSSLSQVRTRMPSADDFFYDLFKTNKTDHRSAGFINYLGLTYEGVNKFLTQAWRINEDGFDASEWRGVNIEEVLTFFEVGSKILPYGSRERKAYRQAEEYLIDFLYPFMPMITEDQHCEYLMRAFAKLRPKDCIFSYNWDTIVDYTLERAKLVQFMNYKRLLEANRIDRRKFNNVGLLLKLHGSFNWLVCKNKECANYGKIRPPFYKKRLKLINLEQLWECPACGGNKMKPEIVPPVSNKMIHSNSFLRSQWLIAREQLLDVTELVFIGYSFPPTDHYTDWLFRQLNLRVGDKPVKVTVVNPEYGKRGAIVTKRYNAIFKGREITSFGTLKEYVDKAQL